MTAICVYRHRAVGAHAGRPARRRDHHARASSPSSRSSRSRPATPARTRSTPASSWLNPFADRQLRARSSTGCCSSVFIYWGWDSTVTVNEESENSNETPGQAPPSSRPSSCWRSTSIVADRRAGLRRPAGRSSTTPTTCFSVLGTDGPRLAAGQAADHRGAHLGGGLDADDDPADRAHVAVDGAREARCRESLGRIHPRFLTPHVSTILMGVAVDRLVRRADDRQREHPLRLDRRARADDRLLLRPDRLRVRRSTTAASCSTARATSC